MLLTRVFLKKLSNVKTSTCQIKRFSTTAASLVPRSFNSKDEVRHKEDIITEIEENLFENSERNYSPVNIKDYQKMYPSKNAVKSIKNNNSNKENLNNKQSEFGIEYKKLSHNDSQLGDIFLKAMPKKNRGVKNNKIIAEGRRLVMEGIKSGLKLQTLLFSEKDELYKIKDELQNIVTHFAIFKVPRQNLRVWSALTTCPGIIGIFERPEKKLPQLGRVERCPITVICDNIREPNNMGAIIRTCAAIPCHQVILMKGCCDPWETKALRGGCGGQFYIDIKNNIVWDQLEDHIPDKFSVFIAESKLQVQQQKCDIIPYYNVRTLPEDHNVVIIGGETLGVSDDAYSFMVKNKRGSCLNIPLSPNIESLNTVSALTLILFEIRKHIAEMQTQIFGSDELK